MYTCIPVLGLNKWHSVALAPKLGINLDFSILVSSIFKFYSEPTCLPCSLLPQWSKAPQFRIIAIAYWVVSQLLPSQQSVLHTTPSIILLNYVISSLCCKPNGSHLIQSNSQNTNSNLQAVLTSHHFISSLLASTTSPTPLAVTQASAETWDVCPCSSLA